MYDIIIIGGGVAGMQAAIAAKKLNLEPIILEKENKLGGKVAHKYSLFPTFSSAEQLIDRLEAQIIENKIDVRYHCEVVSIHKEELSVGYTLNVGDIKKVDNLQARSILITTGYEPFDARIKQEYGYQVYDNIYTSMDLEAMMKKGQILTKEGNTPESIAFIHCVGSRDSQIGNEHCSRVCCVTGVKQATELCQMIKGARVYNFYMDMRMFGIGYEEMYKEAQQNYQVRFIRGRVSELSQTIDHKVRLKAEDTLISKPIAITVDMVILLVGMCGAVNNESIGESAGLELRENGLFKPVNAFDSTTKSTVNGIFYAGCAESPKNISESMNQASQAILNISTYLESK